MKKIIMIIGVILGFAYSISASYINFASQTNHIKGWVSEQVSEDGNSPTYSYDITDSIEINGIVEGWNKIAQSNAGNLHLYAYTVNSIQEGESVALAESTYIFTPSTNLLTLNVIGYVTQWARASFSLFDLTADCEIVIYGSPDTPPYNFEISWQQDFQLNPLHQYRFEMYSMTSPGEDGDGGVELNALFTPEPTSALIMLIGSLLAVMQRRKR